MADADTGAGAGKLEGGAKNKRRRTEAPVATATGGGGGGGGGAVEAPAGTGSQGQQAKRAKLPQGSPNPAPETGGTRAAEVTAAASGGAAKAAAAGAVRAAANPRRTEAYSNGNYRGCVQHLTGTGSVRRQLWCCTPSHATPRRHTCDHPPTLMRDGCRAATTGTTVHGGRATSWTTRACSSSSASGSKVSNLGFTKEDCAWARAAPRTPPSLGPRSPNLSPTHPHIRLPTCRRPPPARRLPSKEWGRPSSRSRVLQPRPYLRWCALKAKHAWTLVATRAS